MIARIYLLGRHPVVDSKYALLVQDSLGMIATRNCSLERHPVVDSKHAYLCRTKLLNPHHTLGQGHKSIGL